MNVGERNECSCARIKVGSEITEHRNWNPNCVEHGLDSAWWSSDEQVAKRQEQNDRLKVLQQRAKELRRQSQEKG
jgi:hypothetical protein